MKCPKIVLNFIKYVAFGLCILYVLDQNKSTPYYLQKSIMIGSGMILVEYIIQNICRDMKENFTTGPGIEEEEEIEPIIPEVKKETETETETSENGLADLMDETAAMEQEIMEEDEMEEAMEEKKPKIEYGYSFVHPDAMKLPEVRIPRCIQDNPCNVCPTVMGGTADLMQVKPVKKPIAGCE